MGLLFDGEQTADPVVWVEPSLADHEGALDLLRQRKSTTVAGGILKSFERAEQMYAIARAVEYPLLRAIADGTVDTVAKAKAFIGTYPGVPAWFPAAKMIAIMIARAGGTPALLRAAALREVGSG